MQLIKVIQKYTKACSRIYEFCRRIAADCDNSIRIITAAKINYDWTCTANPHAKSCGL